jgi:hypothetical protein
MFDKIGPCIHYYNEEEEDSNADVGDSKIKANCSYVVSRYNVYGCLHFVSVRTHSTYILYTTGLGKISVKLQTLWPPPMPRKPKPRLHFLLYSITRMEMGYMHSVRFKFHHCCRSVRFRKQENYSVIQD